jgi:hypothetical protein
MIQTPQSADRPGLLSSRLRSTLHHTLLSLPRFCMLSIVLCYLAKHLTLFIVLFFVIVRTDSTLQHLKSEEVMESIFNIAISAQQPKDRLFGPFSVTFRFEQLNPTKPLTNDSQIDQEIASLKESAEKLGIMAKKKLEAANQKT